MTFEEQRLDDARIAAENSARKERLEAERWKAEFDQKERELRQQETLKQRELQQQQEQKERELKQQEKHEKLKFRGSIIVASIGLLGAILGLLSKIGGKADPNVTNFFGNIYQGAVSSYKLVSSNYSVAQAFPKSIPSYSATPVRPPAIQQGSAGAPPISPTPSPVQPITPVADNTCFGLNVKDWEITPGPVTPSTEGDTSYYTARVNLTNRTDGPMTISRGGGELTDDQNHAFGLTNASISSAYPPTTVDAGVTLPATFVFRGHGNDGKRVWFTVGVQTSNPAAKSGGSNVIGCNALAVQQVGN